MKTVSTHLEPAEQDYLRTASASNHTSISSYIRGLIREDMRRSEAEALMALSIDELASTQKEHGRVLADMSTGMQLALSQIAEQLAKVTEEQAMNAERELQLRTRILESHASNADLLVATLDQCREILDADNSILESVERRLATMATMATATGS